MRLRPQIGYLASLSIVLCATQSARPKFKQHVWTNNFCKRERGAGHGRGAVCRRLAECRTAATRVHTAVRAHRCSRCSARKRQAQDDEKNSPCTTWLKRQHPTDPFKWFAQVNVHFKTGDKAKAADLLHDASRHFPRKPDMHFNHTYVRYAFALEVYNKEGRTPGGLSSRAIMRGALVRHPVARYGHAAAKGLQLPLATRSRPYPGVGCVQFSDFAFFVAVIGRRNPTKITDCDQVIGHTGSHGHRWVKTDSEQRGRLRAALQFFFWWNCTSESDQNRGLRQSRNQVVEIRGKLDLRRRTGNPKNE